MREGHELDGRDLQHEARRCGNPDADGKDS